VSKPRVSVAGLVVAVVAAARRGVENRTGVIGAPTQDNPDGVLDSVTITRRVLVDVDLDNKVRGPRDGRPGASALGPKRCSSQPPHCPTSVTGCSVAPVMPTVRRRRGFWTAFKSVGRLS
jgi:hypothetical protein